MYSVDHAEPGRDPLGQGASPEVIRSTLFPEDRPDFDGEYTAALARAKDSLDLTDLFATLERWRGRAVLQRDAHAYRRVVRRAAQRLTGSASPEGEPLAVTRKKAGL